MKQNFLWAGRVDHCIYFIFFCFSEEEDVRNFICALIRILAAWLAEETMANREEVYEILPFVLTLAVETFDAQKLKKLHSLPGRGSNDYSNFSGEAMIKTTGR